jgi:O-antigen/teichoic acid export membrane protein
MRALSRSDMTSAQTPVDVPPQSPSKPASLIRRLAGNRRLLSLADQAVISITNMGTTIIIGRVCAREQLGLYASGYSLVLLATAVQAALITTPYTISNPHMRGEAHRLYKGNTLLQQICLCAIWMSAFLCAALWTSNRSGSTDLGRVFLTLAVVSGFICFREFARRISCAELRFPLALSIDSLAGLLQLSGIAALAITGRLGAAAALALMGAASGIAGSAWIAANWHKMTISLPHALGDFRRNWAFGKWLFSSSVLWSFSVEQYAWMIAAARGAVEASMWASCYGVMAFLNPIVLALNNDAGPRVSHDYAAGGLSDLRRTVLRSAGIAAIFTSPILIALLLFGARVVRLMYGPKYATGSALIVGLLATGFWLYACGLVFPYGMLALRRQKVDFSINLICFLTFLSVGIASIRGFGALGAAISFLSVQSVAFLSRVIGFEMAARHAAANAD